MKQSKILILAASGGAGHLRAAEALHRTAQRLDLPLNTELYDCLDFTSRTFKKLYGGTYLELVNRTPDLWGYFYQKAELKPYRKKGLIRVFDHFNYTRYLRFLSSSKPDAIVCTHFLPYLSISNVIRRRGIGAPIFAVTTDFDVHQYWVDPIVHRYYVHHEESSWQLQAKGVSRDLISVTGIPVVPEFTVRTSQTKAREILKIPRHAFTILVLSGGFGVGRVEQIVDAVVSTLASFPGREFTVLAICGRNESLCRALRQKQYPDRVGVHVSGFVSNVHEFMSAADVIVSKAGGLTSSEAMVKRLPMIIVDPIPGQEARNADLIIEHGAGWKAVNMANLEYKLTNILKSPQLLVRAREATTHIARPSAAQDILSDVHRHLHTSEKASS
ncbi:MAG TPA: glycosyltransferase [Bacteroidota bacterium]|nr:glycosyltransferase [Bacteroidota bacterium]